MSDSDAALRALAESARNRGLKRVMSNVVVFRLGVWIVMHENLRGSLRMRAMFDHLVDGVTAYVRDSRDCE